MIEDNPGALTLIKRALRDYSVAANITTAEDGEQALHILESISIGAQKPDLVLLDISLPKRSGYEVLEFLKSERHLQAVL